MEKIYVMVCEPQIMYGMGVLELSETRKEFYKFLCRFCKKLMGIPSCAANTFTEMVTAREGWASNYVGQIVQYWDYVYGHKQSSKRML